MRVLFILTYSPLASPTVTVLLVAIMEIAQTAAIVVVIAAVTVAAVAGLVEVALVVVVPGMGMGMVVRAVEVQVGSEVIETLLVIEETEMIAVVHSN